MKKILQILTLISAYLACGQVSLVVEPNKKEILQNEPLVLNFYLEIKGEDLNQETPLRLVDISKFNLLNSSSEQSSYRDPKTGYLVYQMIYQYILMPKKTGKIKIGSSSVIVDKKLYYTEPFDILVKDAEKKVVAVEKSNSQLQLNLEIQDKEVYKNQSTVAVLRAYSRNIDNFRKVNNIAWKSTDNINIQPVSYRKSEIEATGSVPSQIIAVFLIFPKEIGRLELSPASANLASERKLISNKPVIQVKKLPGKMPSHFSNAVGKFDVKIARNSVANVEVEKPIHVSVKVRGDGNLSDLDLPKLQHSEDYLFYRPKVVQKLQADKKGLRGEVVADYVVIPKKSGDIEITTQDFAFFDPSTGKYSSLGEQTLKLTAYTKDELLELRTPLERVNAYSNTVLETVNNPVIKTEALKVNNKGKIHWKTILLNTSLLGLGVLGFIMFAAYKRKSKAKTVKSSASTSLISEKEKEIRQEMSGDLEEFTAYLEKLRQERNYSEFFKVLDELDEKAIAAENVTQRNDFKAHLKAKYGDSLAEDYTHLQHEIQIERFAPMHDDFHVDQILEKVRQFYAQIMK